jgi:hypothetical protein
MGTAVTREIPWQSTARPKGSSSPGLPRGIVELPCLDKYQRCQVAATGKRILMSTGMATLGEIKEAPRAADVPIDGLNDAEGDLHVAAHEF